MRRPNSTHCAARGPRSKLICGTITKQEGLETGLRASVEMLDARPICDPIEVHPLAGVNGKRKRRGVCSSGGHCGGVDPAVGFRVSVGKSKTRRTVVV